MSLPRTKRRFQLVLIKPSHYDDEGYVVQWIRSSIPANSLACLYALAQNAAGAQVLGADVEIDIVAIDETNTRIRPQAVIEQFARHGGFGMVGLVGVQSNQFPRAMDIARPLRAAGLSVVIGGFHVSGCLAMLPDIQPDLQAALDMGCNLFAGEAEDGRLHQVIRDAANGTLEPIYNHMNDLPALESAPTPFLPPQVLKRTIDHYASFDAGRGCPFQCSFCTIINVQGRKSRRRSADDVEQLIRAHYEHGIRWFFITDDNFARNKDWEAVFDRIIALRERDRIELKIVIQVDTLCHRIENFIAKAARAGVRKVFIGLENINPANLLAAKKRQNKITEYRTMMLAWKKAGVITYAGYILGFPNDTPESVREDIEIIKKELPIDILEFFCLTPLPGSEDHKVLSQKGIWMDPDMNKYDLEHVVTGHSKMSQAEWEQVYASAWSTYYTFEHMETVLRRAAVFDLKVSHLSGLLYMFGKTVEAENVHPLQSGLIRLKFRRDRRHGLPLESPLVFYPRYAKEFLVRYGRVAVDMLRMERIRRRVLKDPQRYAYTDQALRDVAADDSETLELLNHNAAARDEVTRTRRLAEITVAAQSGAREAVSA